MKIKNIEKAAKRINAAIKGKENIIVYGDADLDGVSSAIILKEAIEEMGGTVSCVYFPDREFEGYGITGTALKFLKKYSPGLLVAVDCGITNFKEIKQAKKMGFATIVADHHEVIGSIPEADIVVDPKQKGDRFSFKQMAAVGVVFRLIEEMMGKRMEKLTRESFLELTALATIADMVPKEKDNEEFIEKGLPYLETSLRPGIKVFFEKNFYSDYPEVSEKVFKIISLLNVRDIKNRMPAAYRLLTAKTMGEAERLARDLLEKNKIRKQMVDEMIIDVEKRISRKDEPLIFEGGSDFESSLMSSVASILCARHEKPVFIYKKMKEESQGTIRSTKEVNSVELLKKCAKHLLTYGGHPRASGFRIKNKNIDKFRKCLMDNI